MTSTDPAPRTTISDGLISVSSRKTPPPPEMRPREYRAKISYGSGMVAKEYSHSVRAARAGSSFGEDARRELSC